VCCVRVVLDDFLENYFSGFSVPHFFKRLTLLELGAEFLLGARIFLDNPVKQEYRLLETTLF